ncbi:MAG: acyloxyacyl hydrolase [Nitrococcus sp.]|nr:acyloxyacyl hydrolase [Nitrococcus sp.]
MNFVKLVLIGVFMVSVIAYRGWAAEDGPNILQLGAGGFDLVGKKFDAINKHRSAAGLVELRFGDRLFHVGPALGVLANLDGGVYGYGGLYADLSLGNFIFTPLGAVGAYDQGHSKDLGGVLEFRGSITAAYAFANGARFGVQVGHISNANLHNRNPGEEDAFLTYALAF